MSVRNANEPISVDNARNLFSDDPLTNLKAMNEKHYELIDEYGKLRLKVDLETLKIDDTRNITDATDLCFCDAYKSKHYTNTAIRVSKSINRFLDKIESLKAELKYLEQRSL